MPDVPSGEKFFSFAGYKGQMIDDFKKCIAELNESGIVKIIGPDILSVRDDGREGNHIGMVIKHPDGSGSVAYHPVEDIRDETEEQRTLREILENY